VTQSARGKEKSARTVHLGERKRGEGGGRADALRMTTVTGEGGAGRRSEPKRFNGRIQRAK